MRARVLDVHADPDHNRSVFTLVAQEDDLLEALVAGVAVAKERIDLARHQGAHPRVGAADVVPVVPVQPQELDRAKQAALALAERIGGELSLPVFLYGELGSGRGPAFFRTASSSRSLGRAGSASGRVRCWSGRVGR